MLSRLLNMASLQDPVPSAPNQAIPQSHLMPNQ
jgi:hypothetical protein